MSEMKHTPGTWRVGYGKGVTGPTTPSATGATVGESIARNIDPDIILHEIVRVEDIKVHGSRCSSVVAIFPFRDGEEKANAQLFSAAKDLLEAAECEQDLREFGRVNSATQMMIVDKWLKRLDKVLPHRHGKHESHALWTQQAFNKLPEALRKAALAKAKGESS